MKRYFIYAMVITMVAFVATLAFSQTPQTSAKDNAAAAPAEQPAATQAAPAEQPAKVSELSIYGEVQSVNAQASSMSVQYYDYDNDVEKTLEVSTDKDSKLENVKAISEVKKGDWVDVTYVVTGGKNIAKIVSVEVEEPAAETTAPIGTTNE